MTDEVPARAWLTRRAINAALVRARQSRVATNRVFLDARHPSHVVLPLIPRRP